MYRRRPPRAARSPCTPLFRSTQLENTTVRLSAKAGEAGRLFGAVTAADIASAVTASGGPSIDKRRIDRKSTRLNSSHVAISYAVFCLKKKKTNRYTQ